MPDHTLNIWLAKQRALTQQLATARRNNKHDQITPIATELAGIKRKISDRLEGKR